MSAAEEEARAEAYRQQLCRRKAYRLANEARLRGSSTAFRTLYEAYKPLISKEYADAEQRTQECE